MATGTVHLHRVLRAKPAKIYKAFLHAGALARWLPPFGFICTVDSMTPEVGGSFHASFENFTTGNAHSFGGRYLQLVPGELIQYTNFFDDPNMPGEMNVTVKLKAVMCGTEISIEQSGIPEMIPTEMCYLGWQESLLQLANVVEPEIPG